ncbi:Two-component sensor histidine kinase, contains HisKA and HATPase domains [Arenibacter nanhaiticus]|uniref:histidine kinase n=1 Tax=Arenibacter nanhaiticus TaxID=558155 RepID=A0A1M6E737_9FLAO|nr:sensor histidine kinase [Arenibacter nanhaiticus]SHI81213.1 Two-component sensor histidine kinase, contains HisKA and HATPase domains [Arenibacter nanhaiticus]
MGKLVCIILLSYLIFSVISYSCITDLKDHKVYTDQFATFQDIGTSYKGNYNDGHLCPSLSDQRDSKKEIFTTTISSGVVQVPSAIGLFEKEESCSLQDNHVRKQFAGLVLTPRLLGLLLFLLLIGFVIIIQNRRKNHFLLLQIQKKELIIQEIHHRVKNNFEVVCSLLALQAAHVKDQKLKDSLHHFQTRIQSMNMIHQNLCQGYHGEAIEMSGYFKSLGAYMLHTYGAADKVLIKYELEKTTLPIDLAMSLGLLVNELLTNCLKHAFPNGLRGTINIGLKKTPLHLELWVSDDGVGMGDLPGITDCGFGTQLIHLLAKQLDGKMRLKKSVGTSVTFEFQQPKAVL